LVVLRPIEFRHAHAAKTKRSATQPRNPKPDVLHLSSSARRSGASRVLAFGLQEYAGLLAIPSLGRGPPLSKVLLFYFLRRRLGQCIHDLDVAGDHVSPHPGVAPCNQLGKVKLGTRMKDDTGLTFPS